MDFKHAKEILVGLVGEAAADPRGLSGVRPESLRYGTGAVVIANGVGKPIVLDGEFTVDQLEAIVTWMRNPVSVAGA